MTGSTSRPGSRKPPPTPSMSNAAWNRGFPSRPRAGFTASTTRLNGANRWSNASSTPSLTRASTSVNGRPVVCRERTTTVFTV